MQHSEQQRLEEVKRFWKFDFNKTSDFNNVVELAAKLCDKPVALITLLDDNSNWLKVRFGTDIEEMPRETSFCQYAIQQNGLLIIPDATQDPRLDNNPLVYADPFLRFYAGAPITLSSGYNIGTLCLFDQKSGNLTKVQQKVLSTLARHVTSLLELQMNQIEMQLHIQEVAAKNDALIKIAQLQSHQIRQPLTTLMGLINLVKNEGHTADKEWLNMFEIATNNFDQTIGDIIAESIGSKDLRAIRFSKMVEEIDDYAILLLDEKGTIENWNKGAEKIKGYKASEIVGKNFSVFYTEEDIKNNRPQQLIRFANKTGVAKDEGWRVRKDGSRFWGSIIITAIHKDDGSVIGYTKLTRDLTLLKDANEAKMVSVDMFNLMAEQTGKMTRIGGWELDLTTNLLQWTAMTKQIHGVNENFTPEITTAIDFYKDGYSRTKIKKVINNAINKGKSWNLKLQITTKQGKDIWVRSIGISNFKDGVCTKLYGTFQDITEDFV